MSFDVGSLLREGTRSEFVTLPAAAAAREAEQRRGTLTSIFEGTKEAIGGALRTIGGVVQQQVPVLAQAGAQALGNIIQRKVLRQEERATVVQAGGGAILGTGVQTATGVPTAPSPQAQALFGGRQLIVSPERTSGAPTGTGVMQAGVAGPLGVAAGRVAGRAVIGAGRFLGGLLRTPAGRVGAAIGGGVAAERVLFGGGNGGMAMQLFVPSTTTVRPLPLLVDQNPETGTLHFWRHVGRPVLFSGDLATARRVSRLAARAGRARRRFR